MFDSMFSLFGIPFVVPAEAKQVILAAMIGLVMGLERAWRNKVASLRTFSMICAGSCVFTLLSLDPTGILGVAGEQHKYDATRIAAQVVAGVGFLGGGVIFKSADRIEGITTAAMIWLAAGEGMSCGFNRIVLALWVFVVWFAIDLVAIGLHRIISRLQQGRPNGSSEPRIRD